MSRLKIREISARVACLEQLQELRRHEAARKGLDTSLAINRLRQEHEAEHRQLRARLAKVEFRGFIKSLAILLLLGAWVWSLQ